MKTIELIYPHEMQRDNLIDTIAAIGFFDGVHQGHQKVIKTAVKLAKEKQKQAAVISFHPHPSVVLKKDIETVEYISTLEEKKALLSQLGVDVFYIITFNKTLSKLEPELFLEHFIRDLNISHLVAGFDYTFGFKGKGNMKNIKDYATFPLEVTTIDKVVLTSEKISSTRIRQALSEGNLTEVTENLGRPYKASGIVVQGNQRGRKMGFPTANLDISTEKLLPKIGIYAVEVLLDGKKYQGMASLGYNPTFKDGITKPKFEVNIFDFDQQIYGKTLEIIWHKYIRPEIKFSSMDDIIAQMKQDEIKIRKYFEK